MAQDEQRLLEEGNKMIQKYGNGVFDDPDFPSSKAYADYPDANDWGWERVKDLNNDENGST